MREVAGREPRISKGRIFLPQVPFQPQSCSHPAYTRNPLSSEAQGCLLKGLEAKESESPAHDSQYEIKPMLRTAGSQPWNAVRDSTGREEKQLNSVIPSITHSLTSTLTQPG